MRPSKHNSLPIGILYWASQITSVSFEVAFFVVLGYFGDQRWGTSPWFLLSGAVFGLLLSCWHLWQLVRAMERINAKNKTGGKTTIPSERNGT